jgi:hypothetical protein
MKRIIVCVTVDTEADCDTRWKKKLPLQFKSVLFGIPTILRPIFEEYGVRPVYFVTRDVVSSDGCCAVLKYEMKRGAEIGSHLHVEDLPMGGINNLEAKRKTFACYAYSDKVEFEKLKLQKEMISIRLGVDAKCFRAGRFGADINTVIALSKLGYIVDSSVTPHINWQSKGGPDFSDYPDQPYFVDLDAPDFKKSNIKSNVLEVPIAIGNKRLPFLPDNWLFYKWLRPSHMTSFELKSLVRDIEGCYKDRELIVLCMMFHSMEVIPGTSPYVRNALYQKLYLKRLKYILRYLKRSAAEFLTLSDVYNIYKTKEN